MSVKHAQDSRIAASHDVERQAVGFQKANVDDMFRLVRLN
jgi:hypothetical protein